MIAGRIPYYEAGRDSDLDAILQKTMNYENAATSRGSGRCYWPRGPLDSGPPCSSSARRSRTIPAAPLAIPYHRIYSENYTACPPPETYADFRCRRDQRLEQMPFGLVPG